MSKSKKKLIIEKGIGRACPKCKKSMETRSHKKITPKLLRQPYYFSQWDFCRRCKHVQHYEKFKVLPDRTITKVMDGD